MVLKWFQLPLLLLVSLLQPRLTCLLFLSPSFVLIFILFLYFLFVLVISHQPFKDEAQTALFKDPVRTAQ